MDDVMEAKEELLKALEDFVDISYRYPGCPQPECLICLENKRIIETAKALIREHS